MSLNYWLNINNGATASPFSEGEETKCTNAWLILLWEYAVGTRTPYFTLHHPLAVFQDQENLTRPGWWILMVFSWNSMKLWSCYIAQRARGFGMGLTMPGSVLSCLCLADSWLDSVWFKSNWKHFSQVYSSQFINILILMQMTLFSAMSWYFSRCLWKSKLLVCFLSLP